MTITDLGILESLEMVPRYSREVSFKDSPKLCRGLLPNTYWNTECDDNSTDEISCHRMKRVIKASNQLHPWQTIAWLLLQ